MESSKQSRECVEIKHYAEGPQDVTAKDAELLIQGRAILV